MSLKDELCNTILTPVIEEDGSISGLEYPLPNMLHMRALRRIKELEAVIMGFERVYATELKNESLYEDQRQAGLRSSGDGGPRSGDSNTEESLGRFTQESDSSTDRERTSE